MLFRSDSDLRPRRLEPTRPTLLDLLRRYPRCATREVAAVFGVTDDEAEILLEDLEADGTVRRRNAGTGLFWEVSARIAGSRRPKEQTR